MKTWHAEHVVVVAVLAIVWVATGCKEKELLGSLAVYLGHGCASIGARMEEQEALHDKPSVPCFRSYWRYYVLKEVAWFGYFIWSGAWSALVGCVLFGAYPFWRRYWRKRHPLKAKGAQVVSSSDMHQARELYFSLGGVESDIGPRDDSSWYWRRAAKMLRHALDNRTSELDAALVTIDRLQRERANRLEDV